MAPARSRGGDTAYAVVGFDLDGTLVDTAAEIAEAANRTLARLGLGARSPAEIAGLIGDGARELIGRLVAGVALGAVDAERAWRLFDADYAAIAGTTCRPYPGCLEALERLRAGGVRLACLSNKETRFARRVLAGCGLARSFDVSVFGDTLGVRKPDRRVIDHALAALGAARHTMAYVGDSRTDVATARNAGVVAWVVSYGYNVGEPIERAGPDRIFADLGEVAEVVLAAG